MSEQNLNLNDLSNDENTEAPAPKQYAPITPYAAHKIVNIVLASKGQDKVVTPQMMYSYAANNRIKTIEVPGNKKVHFDGNAFKEWLDAYVAGGNVAGGKVNFENLAAQYM
jgi:hypothetical protein